MRAVTYRLASILVSLPVMSVAAGSFGRGAAFTLGLHLMLTCVYYIHERIWLRLSRPRVLTNEFLLPQRKDPSLADNSHSLTH